MLHNTFFKREITAKSDLTQQLKKPLTASDLHVKDFINQLLKKIRHDPDYQSIPGIHCKNNDLDLLTGFAAQGSQAAREFLLFYFKREVHHVMDFSHPNSPTVHDYYKFYLRFTSLVTTPFCTTEVLLTIFDFHLSLVWQQAFCAHVVKYKPPTLMDVLNLLKQIIAGNCCDAIWGRILYLHLLYSDEYFSGSTLDFVNVDLARDYFEANPVLSKNEKDDAEKFLSFLLDNDCINLAKELISYFPVLREALPADYIESNLEKRKATVSNLCQFIDETLLLIIRNRKAYDGIFCRSRNREFYTLLTVKSELADLRESIVRENFIALVESKTKECSYCCLFLAECYRGLGPIGIYAPASEGDKGRYWLQYLIQNFRDENAYFAYYLLGQAMPATQFGQADNYITKAAEGGVVEAALFQAKLRIQVGLGLNRNQDLENACDWLLIAKSRNGSFENSNLFTIREMARSINSHGHFNDYEFLHSAIHINTCLAGFGIEEAFRGLIRICEEKSQYKLLLKWTKLFERVLHARYVECFANEINLLANETLSTICNVESERKVNRMRLA